MKKYLLGAAAALAFVVPGVAAAQSGHVDLGYTSTDTDAGDIDTWTLGGAYASGGQGSLGWQIDGVIGNHEYDAGGDVDTYNLGGHLFTRNDSHLIGGFVNFGNADFGAGDYDYWTVGAEGAIYLQRTTFNGVLSYSDSEDLDNTVTALDLGVTHFISDNFSVGAGAGFGEFDAGSDFNSFGINAEYGFGSMPISVFGGWTTTDFDGFEADALTIGARYSFGGSLFDRDRNGASLTRNAGFGRLGGIL